MAVFFWISFVLFSIVIAVTVASKVRQSGKKAEFTASKWIRTIGDNDFDEAVASGVTLVDFWAPWCTPCQAQNETLNELADEFKDQVSICKINVDEFKKVATQMRIRNIPNIIIYKNGNPEKQLIGLKSAAIIRSTLESVMDN